MTFPKIMIVIAACLCCWLSQAVAADTSMATAEGIAAIHDDNLAGARDSAVNDALRKAVEQVIGTMISAHTVSENYSLLSDRVYSRTEGYVKNYEILSEMPEGRLYRVMVRAEVGAAEIENDLSALGLLMSRKNMPRVMIMVAEQNIGQEYYTYWWHHGRRHDVMASGAEMTIVENVLMRELGKKGFNLVDPSPQEGQVSIPEAYKIYSLTDSAIKEIGRLYNAELVIYGQAMAKLRGSIMGTSMHSSMANVSLRAVRTDNGQVIAADTAGASGAHPDQTTAGSRALSQATEKIASNLLDQIMNRWSLEVSGGSLTQVAVTGNISYHRLLQLRETMRNNIRGIKQIYQRDFSDTNALMEIEYTGPAHDLADGIARTTFDGLTVTVTGVTQNRVEVRIDGY